MALLTRLRELAWYVQFLIFLSVAAGVVVAGELLPYSPVNQAAGEKKQKEDEVARLEGEVQVLRQTERRRDEFKNKVEAAKKQLEATKEVLPDEKRTDDFMRSIQEGVLNSQIGIRRLTAKPVTYEQYYAKMPIEVEIDGGYYNLLDFYQRMSRLTRVVNVGDMKLDGGGQKKVGTTPGATVAGTCLLTTYYSASQAELAAAAPAGRPGAAPARPPTPGAPPGPPGPPR